MYKFGGARPKSGKRGFTAIELLTVLLLIGIFAALAFPSFSSTLKRYRVSAAASEVANALQLARANAIRTRSNGVVSSTSNVPAGCNAPGWGCGMDIWVDLNSDGNQQTATELLKTLPDIDFRTLDVRFAGDPNTNPVNIAYSPLGFLGGYDASGVFAGVANNEQIYVWQTSDGANPAAAEYVNTICLAPGGKVNVETRFDTTC